MTSSAMEVDSAVAVPAGAPAAIAAPSAADSASVSAAAAAAGDSSAAAAAAVSSRSAGAIPRDAVAMQALLGGMGLQTGQYQTKIIAQLMEFANRYQREILEDAQDYCLHRGDAGPAGSAGIDANDIELAVQARMADSFVTPPPKELQFAVARARNEQPLPIVPTRVGVHLPPERFCLMQSNYKIKAAAAPPAARREEQKGH